MNSRLKKLAAAAALTLALSGVTACGSDDGGNGSDNASEGASLELIKSGTLTVCSDVPYPPMEDFDPGSATGFKGFDMDLVKEIADQLGLELEIQDSDFNALKSGLALNAKQCDLIASSMSINPERQAAMEFSEPYFDADQSLLVPIDSSITGIDDLAGKKVGVQGGTTGEAYAQGNASGATLVSLSDDGTMFQALKSGQVDALLQDLPVNTAHAEDGEFKVVETYKTDEKYGLAMRKGNTDLVSAVDGVLQEMHTNGDYQKIYDAYFSKK
jgi:polar amino acid transport system substrate-binding protein